MFEEYEFRSYYRCTRALKFNHSVKLYLTQRLSDGFLYSGVTDTPRPSVPTGPSGFAITGMSSRHRLRVQLHPCRANPRRRSRLGCSEAVSCLRSLYDGLTQRVVRIDVGGKLLTNHLKETVSYRQWNMMEETHIMNEIKEACCFVSEDFAHDLETTRCVHSNAPPRMCPYAGV